MKSGMGCLIAFLSIFYLIGFFVLGCGVFNAWRSTLARTWPTTRGRVTELALKENSDSDRSTYAVQVRYAYTVDGVAYEGSRLAFGYGASSDRAAHDEIYQKLKGARSVSVRYDPANPVVSCLSFGLHRSIRSTFLFSIIWLGFTFGFTCLCWLCSGSDDVLLRNLSIQ
jgi:hypothetical protein